MPVMGEKEAWLPSERKTEILPPDSYPRLLAGDGRYEDLAHPFQSVRVAVVIDLSGGEYFQEFGVTSLRASQFVGDPDIP